MAVAPVLSAAAPSLAPAISARRATLLGLAGGLSIAIIYAGWTVISRLGAVGTIAAMDLVALRFFVSALVLAPVALRLDWNVQGIAGIGWRRLAILSLGAGLPYGFAAYGGFSLAPAGHGAVLLPGAIVVVATIGGAVALGEKIDLWRGLGLVAILAGIVTIGASAFLHGIDGQWRGHALFLVAGALWALYTLAAKAWRVPPLHTAAIIAVLSGLAYLPFYLAFAGLRLLELPMHELLMQGIYQGVLGGVVALILYTKVVGWLGAARAAMFTALVPAFANTMAPFVLDETLTGTAIAGLGLVSFGMIVSVAKGFLAR